MICGEINYFLYFLLSHVTSNNGFGLQSNCEELWSRTILTDQLPPLTPITVKLITSSHQLSRISPPYQRWWKRKAVIDNGNESVLILDLCKPHHKSAGAECGASAQNQATTHRQNYHNIAMFLFDKWKTKVKQNGYYSSFHFFYWIVCIFPHKTDF